MRGYFVFSSGFVILFLFSSVVYSQSQLKPYSGLFLSGDGAFDFLGASPMIGVDFLVNEKSDISSYMQFFGDRSPYGSFTTTSFVVLYQRYMFGESRRFYVGLGLGIQHATKDYIIPEESFNRLIATGAYRIGYTFRGKKWAICPEINTTGPYKYRVRYDQNNHYTIIETFTLPSIGVRVYSLTRDKTGRKLRGI